MAVPPPHAYKPGTKLVVGSHEIEIIKYISEGGFALVYTCYISPPFQGSNIACLKRVQVPSKWQLTLLRQEVDAMRRLRGNKHIVSYIDSHAARYNGKSSSSSTQQYEVFLLMEYCEKNGLIDFMNTRLVHQLTEPEIISIMYQTTIGVAMCHHLQPPLIHRDIKIENVLIDRDGVYKLADFGSSVPYSPPPTNPEDLKYLKDDIMQHTTPQYRAPEMIDLSKGFPIDDKSDVWALGVFMYKLCYYTTPFESGSSLDDLEKAILNSSQTLRFKDQPGSMFSPRLKNIIKCCLRPDPRRRPNAVQLLQELVNILRIPSPNVIPYSVQKELKEKPISHSESAPDLPLKPVKSNKTDPFVADQTFESIPNTVTKSKTVAAIKSGKDTDPFKSIDKSKFLKKSTHLYSGNTSKSTTSLKDYVQEQVEKSEESMSRSRKYEEKDDTLEFLRSKQERTDTGGSMKNAFQKHLRRISTGGSVQNVSANNTGNKRSSISGIKQLLTGGKKSKSVEYNRSVSDLERRKSNELVRETRKNSDSARELKNKSSNIRSSSSEPASSKRNSIASRMQFLLNNSAEPKISKTALGYGKFTDSDDLNSINREVTQDELAIPKRVGGRLSAPKVPASLASKVIEDYKPSKVYRPSNYTSTKHSAGSDKPFSSIDQKSAKTTKKPPPRPSKPIHLKSKVRTQYERTLSNGSDVSIPDIDDLEKQFNKRFPSYA